MIKRTTAARVATSLLVAALVAGAAALGLAPAGLARAAEPNAKTKELIARAPFDRIVLIDNTSWDVEPLSPRPLPVYDPAKKPVRKKAQLPHNGNIGMPGQRSTVDDKRPEEDDEPPLVIHMVEGDVRDYKVKREHIKAVVYFEDMLIEEAERLTGLGKFDKAFEYLIMVQSRQGKWPKLDEAVDRLLFEEGSQSLVEKDGQHGLRLLGELYRRQPKYRGLGDKLASSHLQRI
ncbi:MAG TPA: peptide ABC transporter substrate-binding protein, partial [Isosphaeraceae bacterium]